MTLVDISAPIFLPCEFRPLSSNTHTIDAAGEKAAMIFRIPKTGTLKKIGFKCTKTTTDTLSFRLETVDASNGDPTGTLYDANATGSLEVSASGCYWIAINGTTGISVTADALVAFVVEQGSVPGSHAIYYAMPGLLQNSSFPYSDLYTSSWAKGLGSMVGLEYSDSVVTPVGCCPLFNSYTSTSFKSSSSPNIIGNRFKFPFGARLIGVNLICDLDYACEIILYDSDGYTVLSTISVDPDVRGTANSYGAFYSFPAPVTILADTFYRVAVKATVDTGNIALSYITFPPDGDYSGLSLVALGDNCIYTYCSADPDAEVDWTQTDDKRAAISLLVDQIDIPEGGSWGGSWGA